MWRNIVAINNVLKKNKLQKTILNQFNIKKIKSTNIILENQKIKQKNHVRKHRSNPQYFKGKKLQNEICNRFNIKKVKLTKIILGKKKTKKNKEKKGKEKKKCKKKNTHRPQ